MYTLHLGNSLSILPTLPANSIDSIVTDPPYELGFMGESWDASGIAYSVKLWQEALRVLKPGGHLLAFSGSRTYHRMTCAIEDAGFEVRDQILWVYGSGFPKSLDVSKAIDKAAGAERETVKHKARAETCGTMSGSSETRPWIEESRLKGFHEVAGPDPVTPAAKQWQGWGTALKPAHEPICVARKPLTKGLTVAANVLAHGTGALNIDGCRVDAKGDKLGGGSSSGPTTVGEGWDRPWRNDPSLVEMSADEAKEKIAISEALGRWPANLIHDGSDEVLALFPDSKGQLAAVKDGQRTGVNTYGDPSDNGKEYEPRGDTGSAARFFFFYCAKTSKKDRGEFNGHPTVKPTDLMRYLCRLVTPPGGTVLDPFMGSGSTGKAAMLEEFRFVGIEMDETYHTIAKTRIEAACMTLFADMI